VGGDDDGGRARGVIICFGSINLDLVFALPRLPVMGETLLGPTVHMEPGGKGANQAVAAARDGGRVIMVGAVGRDALAEDAMVLLAPAGVDVSRVVMVAASTGCAAICVEPAGGNLIAVGSGANLAARQTQIEDGLLAPGATLLLQRETDPGEIEALIRRGRAAGARIVLNLAPAGPLARDALRMLDVLVVNEHEAAWLGAELGCAADAGALYAALGVTVVVTLGGDGLLAASETGTIRLAGRPVDVVDTAGAGDCFTGVLAAALDRGMALEAALRRANVAAGLACTRRGTQGSVPMAAEIEAAMAG
jgi:ribokinase